MKSVAGTDLLNAISDEITETLRPYSNDCGGVLAHILRPNVYGYDLDTPDIAYSDHTPPRPNDVHQS